MKKLLESRYHRYKHLVPSRFIYSRNYYRLKDIIDSDSITRQAVIEKQLRHILLTAVRHVPAYRDLGLSSKVILNEPPLALLGEFPYLEKNQLMDSPQSYIRRGANLLLAKYATSGGTT